MATTPPTYSYSHTSGSMKDRVRLYIPDRPIKRAEDPAVFSDEEILSLLDQNSNNPKLAAADACEIIAMDRAKQAVSISINSGMSISKTSIPGFFLQRAKALREDEAKQPWEFIDSVSYEIDELGQDMSSYVGDEDNE